MSIEEFELVQEQLPSRLNELNMWSFVESSKIMVGSLKYSNITKFWEDEFSQFLENITKPKYRFKLNTNDDYLWCYWEHLEVDLTEIRNFKGSAEECLNDIAKSHKIDFYESRIEGSKKSKEYSRLEEESKKVFYENGFAVFKMLDSDFPYDKLLKYSYLYYFLKNDIKLIKVKYKNDFKHYLDKYYCPIVHNDTISKLHGWDSTHYFDQNYYREELRPKFNKLYNYFINIKNN